MPHNLQSRKHRLVHDAIYDAAIDLFIEKGFDETTVEQIAEAAGVSRRSFFRYFASKDDLLAQNVLVFGEMQAESILKSAAHLAPIDVIRETASGVLKLVVEQPRTRHVIAIAMRSKSATQAHMSRLMEVEEKIAAAFATRMEGVKADSSKPFLLAGLTTLIMNASLMAWFHEEFDDIHKAAEAVFNDLSMTFAASTPAACAASAPARDR